MKQSDLLILLAAAAAAYFLLNKKKIPKIIVHPLDDGEFVTDTTKLKIVQSIPVSPPVGIDYTQPYLYGQKPKQTITLNKVPGSFMLSGVNQC